MKTLELRSLIREELKKALKEAEAPLYTDWSENKNPDYIVVHLKDGRKLQISKSHIAGGTKVYQAILQAFIDERTDITNKVVAAMSAMMGGTLKKETVNEGPYWGEVITTKDIPGYEKLAASLIDKIGPVSSKTIKKFSTPMGRIKVVADTASKPVKSNTKPEIKQNGMYLANLINTDAVYAEVILLSPSQQTGSDSNIDAKLVVFYKNQ